MVINSGLQFSLWSGDVNRVSGPPLVLAPGKGALQRLVSDTVSQDELPCLIETVVSNVKAAVVIQCLQGRDAQTFIDVIDQAHVASLYLRGVIYTLRTGTGQSRFLATDPQKMCETSVQDMRQPRANPQIAAL